MWKIKSIGANVKALDKRLDSLEKNTAKNSDSIAKNFDFIEKNFDSMETRFKSHIEIVNDKFDIWKQYVDAETVRVQSRSETLVENKYSSMLKRLLFLVHTLFVCLFIVLFLTSPRPTIRS
jgi:hypothetical protein